MQIQNVLLVAGAASFSTRDVWDGYQTGLREAGIGVVPYPTFSMLRVISPELIGNDIIGKALDTRNGIDAVVFIDGLYFRDRRQWVPQTLTKIGMPTILIATDDPYEEIPNADDLYTRCFTNEVRCGSARVRYLPTATNPPPQTPAGPEHDLVFIGTVFEERWPLLQQLAQYCESNRIRCLITGNMCKDVSEFQHYDCVTVRNEVVSANRKWKLYRGAKVVLNIFRDSETPADSPNPRVFEVTALGKPALLTGPNRDEVRDLYGDSVYHFTDFDTLARQLHAALNDDQDRAQRVARAKEITLGGHLYEHRARKMIAICRESSDADDGESFPAEERLCWIFGCGRTGSTWLGQMLGCVDGIHSWHEPMFGKQFGFIQGKPEEHDRAQSFFHSKSASIWLESMRSSFYAMAKQRFPGAGANRGLMVKEVNAPEFCPYVRSAFPKSRFLLLLRDPFDVLDSYLDMQQPGGWNEGYSGGETSLEGQARLACTNIRRSLQLSLQAFESFPDAQRLRVRYEDLISDPAGTLRSCADLVGIELSAEAADAIASRHDFANHSDTGRLRHRRFGRVGVWKESDNFRTEVREIADEILGGLRTRLEYSD